MILMEKLLFGEAYIGISLTCLGHDLDYSCLEDMRWPQHSSPAQRSCFDCESGTCNLQWLTPQIMQLSKDMRAKQ